MCYVFSAVFKLRLFIRFGKGLQCFADDASECAKEDIDIKPYAAVLHVVDVPLNTLAQFALHAYFANVVFYLRHAGHAGQHFETEIVVGYALGVVACMEQHVWARAYYAHIAEYNIEELRCFVDVRKAEKFTNLGDAVIVNRYLLDVCLIINKHGSEFKAIKFNPHIACAFLHKEDRAFG